ncbi:CBS domain-containing protein [Desulfococcaceae bacterium HSG7]|nr:CBS domain-containing protein [Desulfococcaceae bacterium HSG7]
MITVKDIMTTDLITVTPDTDVAKVAQILLDNHINGAPVVDNDNNDHVVGIICQSDLIAQQKKLPIPTFFTFLESVIQVTSMKEIDKQVSKIAALTVSQAMSPNPVTVEPDTGIETVASLMVDNNFHTLPVIKNDLLVGVVGKEDVLRTLISSSTNQ